MKAEGLIKSIHICIDVEGDNISAWADLNGVEATMDPIPLLFGLYRSIMNAEDPEEDEVEGLTDAFDPTSEYQHQGARDGHPQEESEEERHRAAAGGEPPEGDQRGERGDPLSSPEVQRVLRKAATGATQRGGGSQ